MAKLIFIFFWHVSCFFSLVCFYLQLHCWVFWTTFVFSNIFYWSSSFIIMSIMNGNYNFISNNVKGLKASEKRLKLFEYLKNNINDNGFIFLQETAYLWDEKCYMTEFNDTRVSFSEIRFENTRSEEDTHTLFNIREDKIDV